jgi:NAD(P)-dependent dehydrogenase (short-subunit alcohol dehydrogenase family)
LTEQLTDRPVAVVTGASSGFGANIVRELATSWEWHTVAVARNEDRLAALVEEVGGEYVVCDITDPDSVRSMAGTILGQHGRVDTLVNSAGEPMRTPLAETDPDDVLGILETNTVGALRVVQALRPGLRAAGRADVIDIASAAATIDNPNSGPYSVSKKAQHAVSKMMRRDLAADGIVVHTVLPGKADTEGHPQPPSSSLFSKLTRTDVESVTEAVLGRIGQGPGEVHVPRILKAVGVINGIAPVTTGRIVNKVLG